MLDVTKMTDEELQLAQAEISAEAIRRERLEEKKLWNNFVDALRAYCEKFGDIEIFEECTTHLNYTDFDLESVGEINSKY